MKKALLVIAIMLVASLAFAQYTPPGSSITPSATAPTAGVGVTQGTKTLGTPVSGGSDVLGAHNGYGRGCVMCHAPHSGAAGNNGGYGDASSGIFALWGQDLTPLYGASIKFGDGGSYVATLPAQGGQSRTDANTIILFCLSCHDGSVTKVGMMNNKTVETLPVVGGNAPTLLGADGTFSGNYLNDHPVGAQALVGCGGYEWDCNGGVALTGTTSVFSVLGTQQQVYMTNYPASIWNTSKNPLSTIGGNPNAVVCTTCHDQHSMTVWSNSKGSYPTMFFIKGQYQPTTGGNSVAQFCRNCHGSESNELHGLNNVSTY